MEYKHSEETRAKNRLRLKAWRDKNIDKCRIREHKYYELNKDKIQEYGISNADKRRQYSRDYHIKNRETILQRKREYYQANKDKFNTKYIKPVRTAETRAYEKRIRDNYTEAQKQNKRDKALKYYYEHREKYMEYAKVKYQEKKQARNAI